MWPCASTIARGFRPPVPKLLLPSSERSCGPSDARALARGATRRFSGLSRVGLLPIFARVTHELRELEFDGYAIGGVSVGEERDLFRQAVDATTHLLPADRPRYLMGVGRPQDILDAVATGVDLFDCVLPTRNGRNATCFAHYGYVKLRNAVHRCDPRPIEEGCECLACRKFSRGYLRHLFLAKEMLGPILASIHNLTFLHRLMSRVRTAIAAGRLVQLRLEVLDALGP